MCVRAPGRTCFENYGVNEAQNGLNLTAQNRAISNPKDSHNESLMAEVY